MQKSSKSKSLYYLRGYAAIRTKLALYSMKSKKNPLWLLMFLIGRFRMSRSFVTYFSKSSEGKNYDLSLSIFPEVRVDDVIKSLQSDGIYLGLQLPEELIQELINFAMNTNCYANGDYNCGFLYAEKSTAVKQYGKSFIRAEYYNTAECPTIKRLANDPKLLEIATKYLGKVPVFIGSRMHWIFPMNQDGYDLNQAAMNFHYDLPDYCNLSFFFYLTEVDSLSGPHVCIRGSHKRKKLTYLLSLFRHQSQTELLNYYGSEQCLTVCGVAGFGFAEDVFSFHRATPPLSQDRLLLQIQFAIHDYGDQNDFVEQSLLRHI